MTVPSFYQEFIFLYDDFEIIPEEKVTAILNYVSQNYCSASAWKEKRKAGIMLFAAHLLTVKWMNKAQVAGAVTQLSSGTPPSPLTPTENDLKLTTYGRQYLDMMNSLPITGMAI